MRKFFRTPKGLLTIGLAAMAAVAAPHEGWRTAGAEIACAVAAAAIVDTIALRVRQGKWMFPSGAILTALIVSMVLSVQVPWYAAALTSTFAVLTKYVIRRRAANIFNPAALGIVALFPVLHTGQSWWGSLPEVPLAAQSLLVIAGVFIANRVDRMPLVVAFLGVYFALFTAAAFAADPAGVSEVFRAPDVQAVLFFAFFILTDPPTSPVGYADQLTCAAIVAVVSFAVFEWTGAVYYLLAGVLTGNAWEAWRRATLHARRVRAAAAAS